jgi:predicted DNA-binding protein (MmcQ/YjbR family)
VRGQPFGPEYEVFKVAGKVFVMTTEVPGVAVATLKCEPDYAAALRQEYPSVTVGYHMNKRHWISLAPGPGVSVELVEELVSNSYLLVVAGLPRRLLGDLHD